MVAAMSPAGDQVRRRRRPGAPRRRGARRGGRAQRAVGAGRETDAQASDHRREGGASDESSKGTSEVLRGKTAGGAFTALGEAPRRRQFPAGLVRLPAWDIGEPYLARFSAVSGTGPLLSVSWSRAPVGRVVLVVDAGGRGHGALAGGRPGAHWRRWRSAGAAVAPEAAWASAAPASDASARRAGGGKGKTVHERGSSEAVSPMGGDDGQHYASPPRSCLRSRVRDHGAQL